MVHTLMSGYGFDMGWIWLVGLLVLVGLVLIVFVAVRAFSGGVDQGSHGDAGALPGQGHRSTARQLLDERYAKGELSSEEYRERLTVLDENS